MLNIRRLSHLARHLGIDAGTLDRLVETAPSFCEKLELIDPAKPDKRRIVLNVVGLLRRVQDRLLRAVLLRKLQPCAYSHGGVSGRDIKTNVKPHIGSTFAFVCDISNFYPSVSHTRVYRLFVEQFGCTPDVARACTRICTYEHHLALGLPTSPILADQILGRVDLRIGAACAKACLVYTRFVDDITISGKFDLSRRGSGISSLVERILSEHGFAVNPSKHRFGKLGTDFAITKLRIRNGHLDVTRMYVEELGRQLDDVAALANGSSFQGPYFTQAQIAGRLRFACWVNQGRRQGLMVKFRSIPWKKVEMEAQSRGLIASRKVLRPIRPNGDGGPEPAGMN